MTRTAHDAARAARAIADAQDAGSYDEILDSADLRLLADAVDLIPPAEFAAARDEVAPFEPARTFHPQLMRCRTCSATPADPLPDGGVRYFFTKDQCSACRAPGV